MFLLYPFLASCLESADCLIIAEEAEQDKREPVLKEEFENVTVKEDVQCVSLNCYGVQLHSHNVHTHT